MLLKQSYDVLLSSHASTLKLRRYMMELMDNTVPERLADGRVVVHHRLARSGRFQKLPGPEPHNWVECRVDSRVRPDQTHVHGHGHGHGSMVTTPNMHPLSLAILPNALS